MDIGTISSRYAKALFSLAKEKGLETRVYDDMKMLADSFSLEPGLRVALGNPILPAEEKLKLLTAAGGIEVSDLYERFMHLVLEHKRESLLLFMAHIYIHLYRKDKRITRVQFSTAVPVSEEVKVHLQNKLKEETGTSVMMITHDLGVIAEVADDVMVMYAGKVVEHATCDQIFDEPLHPYTAGLMNCIPRLDGDDTKELSVIEGMVPSFDDMPEGCAFCPRCPYAKEICRKQMPELEEVNGRRVRCFKYMKGWEESAK